MYIYIDITQQIWRNGQYTFIYIIYILLLAAYAAENVQKKTETGVISNISHIFHLCML